MGLMIYVRRTVSVFFEYDTPRYVHINSKKVGIFSRLIQFIILSYIVGYVLVYQKGYQDTCMVDSTVVTKVKGVIFTNFSDSELLVPNPELYRRIWDASDYVAPPEGGENGGFFVMTNVVITPNQTRGKCPEVSFSILNDQHRIGTPLQKSERKAMHYAFLCIPDAPTEIVCSDVQNEFCGRILLREFYEKSEYTKDPKVEQAICRHNSDCQLNRVIEVGNGVQTGECVPSHRIPEIKTCEIVAWCPIEQDILPLNGSRALLDDSQNFTVLIKNTIAFPEFGPKYTRRNIFENANATYLQECIYNKVTDPFCPVFKIKDIVESSSPTGGNFSDVALKGGVFVIRIKWDCNLDWNFMEYCRPHYDFHRTDNPAALIAPGWNFRFANYHEEDRRTLFKKYGLKFIIEVNGEAGKFSIIPLLLNVGSGLALMGLATIICDLIVLYILKNGGLYKEKKYVNVRGEDAFDVNPNANPQTRRNYSRFLDSEGVDQVVDQSDNPSD